jgi:hypothetical protein
VCRCIVIIRAAADLAACGRGEMVSVSTCEGKMLTSAVGRNQPKMTSMQCKPPQDRAVLTNPGELSELTVVPTHMGLAHPMGDTVCGLML